MDQLEEASIAIEGSLARTHEFLGAMMDEGEMLIFKVAEENFQTPVIVKEFDTLTA